MQFTPKLTVFMALIGFLFVMSSCEKDSASPSTVDLITKAPWKFSKATTGGIDVSAALTACVKDNLLTFNAGASVNTGNVNEGPTKCDPADPQQVDFNWLYDESFRKISVTSVGGGSVPILPGGSNEFTLVRVSETELVVSQSVTFFGVTQLVEATLVH